MYVTASTELSDCLLRMTAIFQRRLLAVQAGLTRSADIIAALWNRLPSERQDAAPDPVVLAIFASAGGVSIAAALTLIATVPR
jgi:uncharacterized membrane protein